MQMSKVANRLRNRAVVTTTILALVAAQTTMAQAATATSGGQQYGPSGHDLVTHSPIKHVIIIIGENWHLRQYLRHLSPKSGQAVWNLLSQGIVKPDGTPSTNYFNAQQSSATDTSTYELAPSKTPYVKLPAFHAGGGADKNGTPFGCAALGIGLTPPATNCNTPANVAAVTPYENGLSLTPANAGGPIYYQYLLTGGTGQTERRPHRQHARSRRARLVRRPRRKRFAAWPLPDHPEHAFAEHALRRLYREPRASPVPDVAGSRLLGDGRDRGEPIGLPSRSLGLGSRPPSPAAPTAQRRPPAGSAKARLRCSFSTCRRATRPI